jgi:hypothetical protein
MRAVKTGAEQAIATVPSAAEAVNTVPAGAKAWKGSRVKGKASRVQDAAPSRRSRCGATSGWNRISVSADWVKASCGSIAAV